MVKKFELSAYGVEEMNQKEMVDVEGGINAADFIRLLEKIYGYITDFLASATFDSMAASCETTGGLWCGGADGEFLYQALRGI